MTSLWFSSGESTLSVRRYQASEGVSALFEVTVDAYSPRDDVDLEGLLGRPATLVLHHSMASASASRRYAGLCTAARQIGVEPNGVSAYQIKIAPLLWMLTQRTNHRVFQHLSAPAIATRILAEWGIATDLQIAPHGYPELEYRVQYGESDFAFFDRLLQEAGIAHTLRDSARDGERGAESEVDDGNASVAATVVLSDRLAAAECREGGPIRFEDAPSDAHGGPYVTAVRIAHELRPGRVALRGADFRRRHDAPLVAEASANRPPRRSDVEGRLEQHIYAPGAFVANRPAGPPNQPRTPGETPVADYRAVSRADEKVGAAQAAARLAVLRDGRREVSFRTNLIDLVGTTMSISGHGHAELAAGEKLLVVRASLSGGTAEPTVITATAVFADEPHRPARASAKPVVHGVESAVVVGPSDEDIHTDEFGRVRVQFAWDREGDFDDRSSCWIRVSQGWAGAGYGLVALPRVGQEVIVGFFGGDPDQPVIVGRLFNATSPVPNKLPQARTRTTWKSASSPGGEGGNEITFEDEKGGEHLLVRAERDLSREVGAHESTRVGGDRRVEVEGQEHVRIGGSQLLAVGKGRSISVGGDDEVTVAGRHAVRVGGAQGNAEQTGIEVVDRKITLSTGEATITLEGPNITLDAAAGILLHAAADLTINGRADIHLGAGANVYLKARQGELVIQGGPEVRINPRDVAADDPGELPMDPPPGLDMDGDVLDADDLAIFHAEEPRWLERQLAPGGAWDPGRWGEEHEEFASFHLGVMAAAAGIPVAVMARQRGRHVMAEGGDGPERGDPGNGLFGGKAPYGNAPQHHELMLRGAAFHGRAYIWSDDGEA